MFDENLIFGPNIIVISRLGVMNLLEAYFYWHGKTVARSEKNLETKNKVYNQSYLDSRLRS